MIRSTWLSVRRFGLSARIALALAGAVFFRVADPGRQLAWSGLVASGFIGLLLILAVRDLRRSVGDQREMHETELAVTAGVLGGALLPHLDSPYEAALRAALMLLVTFAAVVASRRAGLALALVLAGMELAWLATHQRGVTTGLIYTAALLLLFVVTSTAVRRAVSEAEDATRALVQNELDRMRETARSYRLGGFELGEAERAGREPTQQLPQLVTSSVEELHSSLEFVLRLVAKNLHLRTVALLWIEQGTSERISVREVVSDVADLREGPFDLHSGIVAAALTSRQPVVIEASKAHGRMPLYLRAEEPSHIYAVPLFEGEVVSGVLLADTRVGHAHPKIPKQIFEVGDFVLRAIHAERLLLQTERSKTVQRKLYQAAEALAQARVEKDVIRAGVESARRFTSFDFAAVTLYDAAAGAHEICAVSGPHADELVGSTFRDNGSLVSLVVSSRHSLPYRGEFFPDQQLVFASELPAPELASLLVLPLLVHDEVLGTLTLGSFLAGTLGEDVRPALEILAQHVAVSLANARMVKRLGELATTDGMTGHLNKRALLETAHQKICSAARFSKPLSVIVGDIDLFKRVNDGYGHDVGDVVIRGFGNVLRRTKRETDAVGRFGGEEFVLVCEETDATGARLLAERIRQELGATVFHTEQGPLQVTCSLGVATMPVAGCDWEQLFKASDEALYAAKRAGRNRVAVWTPGLRAAVA
jgi:two-component system, cell cycle response regulator